VKLKKRREKSIGNAMTSNHNVPCFAWSITAHTPGAAVKLNKYIILKQYTEREEMYSLDNK